jgi:lipoate-protein ligase A
MSSHVRLLPFEAGDGPSNMAADEALLVSAVGGVASLRFYSWSSATLSLGYFQPAAAARARPDLGSLPWVRRATGGSALVHHHELTYALVMPAGSSWQPPCDGWTCWFHDVIRAALLAMGIDTRLCRQEQKLDDVLCFLHHTPGDLLLGSNKIAGSAQRKRHGALLQHGDILLAQSPYTHSLPGIAELTGKTIAPSTLQDALVSVMAEATGWRIEPDNWSSEERQVINDALPRYCSLDWNNRR